MDEPKKKQRQCTECQNVYDLNGRYFAKVTGTHDNFKTICKRCVNKKRREKEMAALEVNAVKNFLTLSKLGGSNIPHTAELLESIMHYFGGSNGFASLLMKQYFESSPGSRQRNAILDMIFRLASKNTEQGGARKPMSLYSEDELEKEINDRLKQAVVTFGGKRFIDATQDSTAALPAPADSAEHFLVPEGRVESLAERIEREANRSLEALQANPQADGLSSMSVK